MRYSAILSFKMKCYDSQRLSLIYNEMMILFNNLFHGTRLTCFMSFAYVWTLFSPSNIGEIMSLNSALQIMDISYMQTQLNISINNIHHMTYQSEN